MSLIVETGTGVADAASYASIATIDAYWADRGNDARATSWADASTAVKEGAAREATKYLDDTLATAYRGRRAGYVQGREWPRTDAFDDEGFDLPDLPPQLVEAVCELAVRAIASRLTQDADINAAVKRKREKVDVIEEETEYFDGSATLEAKYGLVMRSLAPILNGTQRDAPNTWAWR